MFRRVEGFYRHQDLVLDGLYQRPVKQSDHDKTALIEELCGAEPKKVLELGAGGGQCAFATAERGHDVTAVELVPEFAEHGNSLAKDLSNGSLVVLCEDFYALEINDVFDVVVYWDGFGVGTDKEQRHLLRRIAGWLSEDGIALIDIYTPWNAIRLIDEEMTFGDAQRQYGYDAEGNRWLDTWWRSDQPADKATQSLRCYSPADLLLLLEGTGLELAGITLGGHWDADAKVYHEAAAELGLAIWYTAQLRRRSG